MSQRFFESEKHVALYAQFRPIPPQKLIETITNFLKEKYQGSLITCVDVGCGNGQCTDLFPSYFEKVIGIDVSPAQIEVAKKMNHSANVEFWVGPAEQISVESGSVQVVNASMAAHWFNLPAFFEETKRILCTDGVVALSGHSLDSFEFVHPSKSKELQQELKKLYVDQLSPYYGAASTGIKHTLNEYADIKIPFEESVRCEIWTEEKPITIAALANLFSTTYPYQELCRKNGDEAGNKMLDEYQSKCQKILDNSEDTESKQLKVKIKYFLLMGRKIRTELN